MSLHVPFDGRVATIVSPIAAIDRALGTGWVHDQIRDSRRAGWIRVDMELRYRASGLWQWRVVLWSDVGDPQGEARTVVSFVVNARTGAVTHD